MLFKPSFPITALFALASMTLSTRAVLSVKEPSAAHWWVGQAINTLAWEGTTPTEFTVLLVHPDVNILTDRLAIEAIVPTYIYSKSINPGQARPAQGYTLQLANPLNSSEIYATSEAFEIKPANSAYPSQVTPTPISNSSSAASASAAGLSGQNAGGGSGTVTSAKSGANANTIGTGSVPLLAIGSGVIGGMMVFEGLMGLL